MNNADFFADDLPGDMEEFGVELLEDQTGFGWSTASSVTTLSTGGCPFSTIATLGTASSYT